MARPILLELSTLLRHAFLAGRGISVGGEIKPEDSSAWTSYNPPDPAYSRVTAALSAVSGADGAGIPREDVTAWKTEGT